MSETKFEAKAAKKEVAQVTEIEAKEVILNLQKAALDLDTLIDRHVRQKYPSKHIARPSQEEARNHKHKGWQLLKYIPETQSLEVVTKMDEATTTQSNVLCWRDKAIQDYLDNEERKARLISSRRASGESTTTQAAGLNDSLAGLSGGKVRAKPLNAEDGE